MLFSAADATSVLSVGVLVGVLLGSALILLLIVLLILLFFCRRRKHVRRSTSTSRSRRLPTFVDVTLHSEITSFLPAAGSINGLRGAGEVSRQPTAETDDMPPSYDSVVKSSDDIVVRRRRDGNLTSPAHRSQARLSLPPLSATIFPPIIRTHRRAESDVEEHIYEDPASLRRSVSRDRLGRGLQSSDSLPAMDYHEVSQEDAGPSSSEIDDQSPLELLMPLAASADTVTTRNPAPELRHSVPYSITSNSLLNTPISSSQPRVPRVRLGTSALYCRPDSRAVDWLLQGNPHFSTNQLQPFSPLSAVGYSEVMDSFTHPYETPGDDFPFVHNPHNAGYNVHNPHNAGYNTSFDTQPPAPWSQMYIDDPELRSQNADIHSTPSGNRRTHSPTAVSYFSNDLSVVEDQLNSTSSAHSSLTEPERFNGLHISPLFDDDNVDSNCDRGD